jgi:hypothetical protein
VRSAGFTPEGADHRDTNAVVRSAPQLSLAGLGVEPDVPTIASAGGYDPTNATPLL